MSKRNDRELLADMRAVLIEAERAINEAISYGRPLGIVEAIRLLAKMQRLIEEGKSDD